MDHQNLPPAYDDPAEGAAARPDSSAGQPPTYALAADSDPRQQLFGGELPSLVLDGVQIYPAGRPGQPLYELSTRISSGSQGICGVEKVVYRLTDTSGEGSVRARTRHIYDLRPSVVSVHMFGQVDVLGKLGPRSTYKHKELLASRPHWSSCGVKDTLHAKEGFRIKLVQGDKPVEWKDKDGRVVALETTAPRPKDDASMAALPRLDVQLADLDAKDFDFLVACWVGRLWRVYQIHNEEPFSLQKFRRLTAQSPFKGGGLYGGGM